VSFLLLYYKMHKKASDFCNKKRPPAGERSFF
jgi:hypothetical protein